MSEKHLFAFFWLEVDDLLQGSVVRITNQELVHRIHTVLRMRSGDFCIFFNTMYHLQMELIKASRTEIVVKVLGKKLNAIPLVRLILVLPLLKRDALYSAVCGATEMGVSEIQLVITKNSRQAFLKKEYERLKRGIIAASELSKHFTMAQLHSPVHLLEYFKTLPVSPVLLADQSGASIIKVLHSVGQTRELVLCVGPEGDFSTQEKKAAQDCGAISSQLTPTILQSYQAATLLSGICSSYFIEG